MSWTPIQTDKENGIILQHKASFSAINGVHSGYKSFEANTSQGVIDGLYPFKEYAIRLSVSTIKGFGPISEVVHVTTEEARKSFCNVSFLYLRIRHTQMEN